MLSKEAREFILHATGYFRGHWEDPEWGRRPVDQVLINLTIHELANGITDEEVRQQIQGAVEQRLERSALEMVRGS